MPASVQTARISAPVALGHSLETNSKRMSLSKAIVETCQYYFGEKPESPRESLTQFMRNHHRRFEAQIKMPLVEQWVNDYWYIHIHKGLSVGKTDKMVRKLIGHILVIGDEQLAYLKALQIISPLTLQPLEEYANLTSNKHFTQENLI